MSSTGRDPSLEARLSATEANVDSLAEDVRQLSASIADVAKNMQIGFDALRNQLNVRDRPQWNVYASWTAVVMSIVGMVGTAVIRPMAADLARLEARMGAAETLLISRGLIIANVERENALNKAAHDTLVERVDLIEQCGSPITDKRLSLLEYRLGKSEH